MGCSLIWAPRLAELDDVAAVPICHQQQVLAQRVEGLVRQGPPCKRTVTRYASNSQLSSRVPHAWASSTAGCAASFQRSCRYMVFDSRPDLFYSSDGATMHEARGCSVVNSKHTS